MSEETALVAGNAISFIACGIAAVSGCVKSKNKTLVMQSIQLAMSAVACIILGSMSGAVLNTLAVPRNILACINKLGQKAKITIATLSVFFAVMLNQIGWIGLIPILPTALYTFGLDKATPKQFKLMTILLLLVWTVHDMLIKSYVSSVFNIIQITLSAVAIIRITHDEKEAVNET